jgi:hypothetical protein
MKKILAGGLIIAVGLVSWGAVSGHPDHSATSVSPIATHTTASVPASDRARFRPVLQGPVMTCLRLLPRVQAEARTLRATLTNGSNSAQDTGTLLDDARTLGHICVGAETRVLALRFPPGLAHDLARRAQKVLATALWTITSGGDYAVSAVELNEQGFDLAAQQIVESTESFQTAHAQLSTARALLHF